MALVCGEVQGGVIVEALGVVVDPWNHFEGFEDIDSIFFSGLPEGLVYVTRVGQILALRELGGWLRAGRRNWLYQDGCIAFAD